MIIQAAVNGSGASDGETEGHFNSCIFICSPVFCIQYSVYFYVSAVACLFVCFSIFTLQLYICPCFFHCLPGHLSICLCVYTITLFVSVNNSADFDSTGAQACNSASVICCGSDGVSIHPFPYLIFDFCLSFINVTTKTNYPHKGDLPERVLRASRSDLCWWHWVPWYWYSLYLSSPCIFLCLSDHMSLCLCGFCLKPHDHTVCQCEQLNWFWSNRGGNSMHCSHLLWQRWGISIYFHIWADSVNHHEDQHWLSQWRWPTRTHAPHQPESPVSITMNALILVFLSSLAFRPYLIFVICFYTGRIFKFQILHLKITQIYP